jgi:outer membrane lipoprotein-sorting protein
MRRLVISACLLPLICTGWATAATPDPATLIQGAIHYWRGTTSYSVVDMTIHRPDWERTMSMRGWTRGESDSLIRFTAPPKDSGNATLKVGDAMWIYTPKLRQIIKLPASMMAQSWMGSDFSYNDLAKSDQIIHEYTHRLISTKRENGHTVYTIESIPKPGAPVVWGKERVRIRDDHILLEETFFDQNMKPVKSMVTRKIAPLGGRPYPVIMRMTDLEQAHHWTQLHYRHARFSITLPAYLFTQSNLSNPRPWSSP